MEMRLTHSVIRTSLPQINDMLKVTTCNSEEAIFLKQWSYESIVWLLMLWILQWDFIVVAYAGGGFTNHCISHHNILLCIGAHI